MNATIPVNFHCHSFFSDGEHSPDVLAASLVGAGVRYAALTDHDSLEGLPRFSEALRKRGVACLPAVEVTTWFHGREAHLLGYGIDVEHPELVATLQSLRQVKNLEVHSITGSLRRKGTNRSRSQAEEPPQSASPDGRLEIAEGIALIHRAGGRAFWAHPWAYEQDLERLSTCLSELKALGLEGVEVNFNPGADVVQAGWLALARAQDLLLCTGTDFHTQNGKDSQPLAAAMPLEDWKRFRQAVFDAPAFQERGPTADGDPGTAPAAPAPTPAVQRGRHFRVRAYMLRILLPTLIAIGLFLGATWGIILPSFEQTLLERKRELIRELTNSAWSILASYERDERSGLLSREDAQQQAQERIEALRYGPESKDYFWIQDLQPVMIMHPYRSDLNGQDLSDFTDERGVAIFIEFADIVRRDGEGYIDYVWQWKDDPERLEPKQSYVRGFEPWGWVIGTGIYIDDVHAEIERIERSLVNTSLIISGVIVLLLGFVLQQTLQIERQRQAMLDSLKDSTERNQALVDATTEGTLLILDGTCRYANPIFLGMTGYSARQLEFLDLADLLPADGENQAIWQRFEQPAAGQPEEGEFFEGVLHCADGSLLECLLALNPISIGGQSGFILLGRDLSPVGSAQPEAGLHAGYTAPLGIFRARAARRGVLIESNPAARQFFSQTPPALADLFSDPGEFESVLQNLRAGGEVREHLLHIEDRHAAARFLSLSANLVREESTHSTYIDGILADVTTARRQAAGREALIERLQASLLFLQEPLAHFGRDVLACDMRMSIAQCARMMTARSVSAAVVTSEAGEGIGIVTDNDLRERVLAQGASAESAVHTIMSAPLKRIPEHALVYEALMRMEEQNVRHLAVEDRAGTIVSVIDHKVLIQFQRYGPVVLGREIARAKDPAQVAQHVGRTPLLARALLESSARPRHVTSMLASICDSATERLVTLAVEQLGPPPVPFTFIAMGSQGRQEQTLLTDQDNGIIYAPPAAEAQERTAEYFLQLGGQVSAGLAQAGFAPCRGGVMAGNPRWCRSLPAWIAHFEEWVRRAEPQEIIDLSIFFDFRSVVGEAALAHELRQAIHAALSDAPAFFTHFASNTLAFKPPFRLLGSIYLGGAAQAHSGEINLKEAMMPIVAFARLYALQHQVPATHTLERIEALSELGVVLPASRDEIATAYDFLMQLRLRQQSDAIQAGSVPTNSIHPGKLGSIQQEVLKQAFAQIAAVQKKVSYDFLGGA